MRLTALAALVLAGACSAATPADTGPGETRAITARGRALDGDTVSIDIRLSGADAFESRQLCRGNAGCWQCGKAAQDIAARALKSGDAVIRLTGTTSYGRPVGTVTIGGRDLGETMIAAGLAVPVTGYLRNDPDRASRYVAAYDRAVATRAGAHAGYFIDPARWRRGERLSCETKGSPRPPRSSRPPGT
ncbi:Endonuclease YncB, thermonuclease family [Sphingomonas sp. OV641]|jgi:endonuclease YncB( thermonuclease family)|uniref:thermonuclease family protein n=1 Tax=Sphingomonas TaxID=13687 RepID=UPI0008C0BD33|nr:MULTISPECIES: thermonuclease family protein [unclassified Sphingomonas]RSU65174.1 thermonuclease family protein [Sphingomonas sp. S-NIH.Pt1_0416]SEJ92196.1 Endonuclease YncB, thermonuclease family [Sphingomonas sp. OV641]